MEPLWPLAMHLTSELPILLSGTVLTCSPSTSAGSRPADTYRGDIQWISSPDPIPNTARHPVDSGSLSAPCYIRAQTRALWEARSSSETHKGSFESIIRLGAMAPATVSLACTEAERGRSLDSRPA